MVTSQTSRERETARQWAEKSFDGEADALPFSFLYGGKRSAQLVGAWRRRDAHRRLDAHRSERTITLADPASGLVVRCVAVEYRDFPVVEWTVFFRNDGRRDTPIIADLQALDASFPCDPEGGATLHHHVGSPCRPDDYKPLATVIERGMTERITTSGGRSSNSDLPYFNVRTAETAGVIMAVGWPGQWAAEFERDGDAMLAIRAGQELTHFTLHPGEQVRTPLIALLFWNARKAPGEPARSRGATMRSQNLWRRWMLAHNVPKPAGALPEPHLTPCSSHQYGEMVHADEASQLLFIDRYREERLDPDYWWMDAGWYPNETGWPNTGTWEVDRARFPRGLRAITDHAHAVGMKSIVWFEPERVTPGTWLYDNHPEWLLGADGEQKLLDLGNERARRWLIDHVDHLITEEGIDLYRQDFNMDPLDYWRKNDPPDRQGMTEIGHVAGLLEYWDELCRRHPNLLIDTCASGGRRNDLEILRRAVPLLRSDYLFEPTSQQCHTYGIASWYPYYGTGVIATDEYSFRSIMCPNIIAAWDVRRKDLDYDLVRRLVAEWREVAGCYFGDYYPLTSYSLENDVWMAWQFDCPDLGEGMVQVFRRPESLYEQARFFLHGLVREACYTLERLGGDERREATGRQLMEDGLVIMLEKRPCAEVFVYRKTR